MKIKGLLLGFVATLSIGSAVFVCSNNANKVELAEASGDEKVSGLFYRVERPSDISVGDEILLISTNGYAPDDFYGNPAYLHASNTGIMLSADGTLATLSDSPAALFTVESGLTANTYALKSTFWIGGITLSSAYLGINNGEFFGGSPFGYATYFFGQWDRTGLSLTKTNDETIHYDRGTRVGGSNTEWTFAQYDTGKVTVRHALSNDDGGDLKYTTDYSPRFCRNPRSGSTSRSFVYKMIDEGPSGYTVTPTNPPTKTFYNHGEEIDLSGLQVKLIADKERFYDYDGNEKLFTFPKYAYGDSDPTSINVSFAGKIFSLDITVTRENASGIIAGPAHDYRGTYMLAALVDANYGYAVNANMAKTYGGSSKTLLAPVNGKPGRWAVDYSYSEQDPFVRFEVTRNEEAIPAGKYYNLRNVEIDKSDPNNPITIYNYLVMDDNFGIVNEEDDSYTPLSIVYDNVGLRVKNKKNSGDEYLVYDSSDNGGVFKFIETSATGGSIYPVYLYKFDTLDSLTPVENYVKKFLSDTAVCDMTGQNKTITKSIWQGLAAAFNNLSVDSQAILVNEGYTHNEEKPGSIGDMVDRYDFIIHKYIHPVDDNDYIIYDFMHREIAGTSQNNVVPNSEQYPYYSMAQNDLFGDDGSLILLVVSLAVASSAFGFIVLRKKKKEDIKDGSAQ